MIDMLLIIQRLYANLQETYNEVSDLTSLVDAHQPEHHEVLSELLWDLHDAAVEGLNWSEAIYEYLCNHRRCCTSCRVLCIMNGD